MIKEDGNVIIKELRDKFDKKNLDFRFGDLVRDMWSPSTSKTIAPIKMRWTISRYSQNFSGFQQQDSQGKLHIMVF